MSAITDMPANTARPIGSTDKCRPGSMNVAADVEDAAAADGDSSAAAVGSAAPSALSAASVGELMTVGTAEDWIVLKPCEDVQVRLE
jgi:hypothetical protein